MSKYGARPVTVSAAQSAANSELLRGPLKLVGWSLNDGNASQDNFADSSQAAPGAGVTIASTSLNNGTYVVQWWFELTGTPGAGDVDNVSLSIGATQVDQSVNLGAVGNYGPFSAPVVVTGGPLTLAAKAIGAATAGTTYKVKLVVTPTGQATATINDSAQALAFVSIQPNGVDTHCTNYYGVQIRNSLKVQATQGTVSGVVWVEMLHGLDPDDDTSE